MVGLGFFAPLPLAVMIPFMAMQSGAMALAFGTYFQYGKRRISAMSNEEFNKIQPGDIYKGITDTINAMIPSFRQQNASMQGLQQEILKQLMEYAKQAAATLPEQAGDVLKSALGPNIVGAVSAGGKEILNVQNELSNFIESLTGFFNFLPQASAFSGGGATPNQLYVQPQNQPGFIGPPVPGPNPFQQLGITDPNAQTPLQYYEALKGKSIDPVAAAEQQLAKGLAGAAQQAAKVKAPKSIVLQFNKIMEDIKARQFRINRGDYNNSPLQLANNKAGITNLFKEIAALQAKYHSIF